MVDVLAALNQRNAKNDVGALRQRLRHHCAKVTDAASVGVTGGGPASGDMPGVVAASGSVTGGRPASGKQQVNLNLAP